MRSWLAPLRDAQVGEHPAQAVVAEAAPQAVTPGKQAERGGPPPAGERLRQRVRAGATDAAEREIVLVLAEVRELDQDAALGNALTREPVLELERRDLDAGGAAGAVGGARPHEDADRGDEAGGGGDEEDEQLHRTRPSRW